MCSRDSSSLLQRPGAFLTDGPRADAALPTPCRKRPGLDIEGPQENPIPATHQSGYKVKTSGHEWPVMGLMPNKRRDVCLHAQVAKHTLLIYNFHTISNVVV